jgi:two-component system response regulator
VADGIELLKYLRREGLYKDSALYPTPSLILLDLNMPRLDGRGALMQIKADPNLRGIPVIVLTTSKAEEDMLRAYDLGAASYITKPVTFDRLVELMRSLSRYWVEFVELPNRRRPLAGS